MLAAFGIARWVARFASDIPLRGHHPVLVLAGASPYTMSDTPSPKATNLALVATLVVTLVAVVLMLSRPLDAREAATYLALFTFLFVLRVLGQIAVLLRAPSWLPRVEGENWNLVPYRILLPAQLLIFALMCAIVVGVWKERPPFGARNASAGLALIAASAVYAGVMAVRYVVRMARRPDQRWFGGAIPIVFHFVLAAFLLTWGRYHLSR
jgi:hypothetical protein